MIVRLLTSLFFVLFCFHFFFLCAFDGNHKRERQVYHSMEVKLAHYLDNRHTTWIIKLLIKCMHLYCVSSQKKVIKCVLSGYELSVILVCNPSNGILSSMI